MASDSRTQRLLRLIKLFKEKQFSEPDKWAERMLIKEEAYEQWQAEKKKRQDEIEEAEKQRQQAEKQREYESRKRQKIIQELEGYNSRIHSIQLYIKDYDQRMRLWNIIEDSHKARIEFIESQDLNEFASDAEDEEIKKSNTQVIQNVTEPVTSSLVSRNQEFEHPTWTTPVTSSPSLPVVRPPPIPKCPLSNSEDQDCLYRVSNHNIRTLTDQDEISQNNSFYAHEEFKKATNTMKKEETKNDTNSTHQLENTKELNEHKNNATETKNEPDHKTRIDNIEPMIFDSSKSTCPDQTTTSSSPPTSTCPSLYETTYPPISSTYQSPTTIDDSMPQDLNNITSASISIRAMSSTNNTSYNQDESQQPLPEVIKETHSQLNLRTDNVSYNQESYQSEQETEIRVSISDTSERKKSVQPDFVTDTNFTHIQECESTKESSIMNIASQRILHEHKKIRQFAQGNKVRLLLPDLSNKLFYKWQGPFTIIRKISNLLYEIKINKYTRLLHVHMLEHYYESDEEDTIAEIRHFTCPATITEEEETSSTPIPEIDVSLPASIQIDNQKIITPDDRALQILKNIIVFKDQAEHSTSIPGTLPVLNIDIHSRISNLNREVNSASSNMNINFDNSNNSECSNIDTQSNSKASDVDNTHPHSPLTQWTDLILERTNELIQHYCIDSLNFNVFSHCSIGHSYTEHFTNITIQLQGSLHRKLCFGIGQFIFLPDSNAIQSDTICVLNTRRKQLRKLKDLFFKFRKNTLP